MIRALHHFAIALLMAFAAAAPSFAQNANAEAAQKAAVEAMKKVLVAGPADVKVANQATLKLPKGYYWVPTPEATKLLESMGNRPGADLAGLVFDDADAWFAVVRYVGDGHIKDDDAKDWNADDLLASLKEGTEAANEDRARMGIPAIEVVGWSEKPKYDATTHRLVWSATTRRKGTSTGSEGVNYNTYALGREGYISLNLVTALDKLEAHKPAALELLGALQFNEGRRYADFNSSTDKVAAYGLAALVAGAAAKKLGLFAVLFAFFAKFAKVIIVAGGAAVWALFKLFGRKKPEPVVAEAAPAEAPTDTGKPPGAV